MYVLENFSMLIIFKISHNICQIAKLYGYTNVYVCELMHKNIHTNT